MPAVPAAAHSSFSRSDIRTLGLAALGGSLEIYDFIIFAFFATTLSQVFFPADMPSWLRLLQTFGIFAAGYLARPLGGIVMAHFADRHGRKRVFNLSIAMMALPCLVIAMMPTYAQIGYAAPLCLLALRILQGAAVGGEVPSAWVFVAEHAPPHRPGLALGILQAGLTFGYLLGALTGTALTHHFTAADIVDYAWRIPFMLAGVFGLFGMWLRRWLVETPVFIAMHQQQALGEHNVAGTGNGGGAPRYPAIRVLREHTSAILPAIILTCLLTSAVVTLIVVTPTLLQRRFGMSAEHAFGLSSVAIVFLNIGCVLAGWVSDRIGAWRSVALYSVALPCGVGLLYANLILDWGMTALTYSLAALSCGLVGAVPSVMVRLFPAHLRVSGISLTYNLAYAAWASTTPLLLIALTPWTPWICVYYTLMMGALGWITARLPRHRRDGRDKHDGHEGRTDRNDRNDRGNASQVIEL